MIENKTSIDVYIYLRMIAVKRKREEKPRIWSKEGKTSIYYRVIVCNDKQQRKERKIVKKLFRLI